MRNLFNFIIKYSSWFVFLFYVIISLVLLFSKNDYQQSVYLTSANGLGKSLYGISSNVSGYFNLRSINAELVKRNDLLENEVLNLRHQLSENKVLKKDSGDLIRYEYIPALVLNNSVRHPKNYFTINRGSADGVESGMGVINHQGVLGIVNVVGKHTARVVSLLNETQHFSVKLKNTQYVGSLSWHGMDPSVAYVEELPQHIQYHVGDTVVTSGYSTTFPADITIGTIMSRVLMHDNNYVVLKIRLLPNFHTLEGVRILRDNYKQELDSLTQYDQK